MTKPSEGELNEFANRVLKFLHRKGTPGVFFLSSREIKDINRKYRGVDKTTNVLAIESPADFPSLPAAESPYLGDVYLNPDYIAKHKEDFHYLLIHGLLHLLGFNHLKASDRMKMEKEEQRILTSLVK
ncbi:MAG TPA: rRNA maturation RNase YbeY [Candidatus Tyrphobacter sp.]|nr:rRNA maturation RNase YbeY [Candidatus Tyrphobacter sp.]